MGIIFDLKKYILLNLSRLISRGSQTMGANSESLVEFFKAIQEGDIDKVDEMLSTKQAVVEARNGLDKNETALHIAASKGHERLTKLLIEKYKANVNTTNSWGKNPLEAACDNYHRKICKYLIENNSDKAEYAKGILNSPEVDELFNAAEANDIAKVSELIEIKGVDVDSKDKGGYRATVLHVAAKNGYEELVDILVNKYRANINHEDDIGDRTIHVAAQCGHENIVNFLAQKGSKDSEEVLKFVASTKDAPVVKNREEP